MAEKSKEELQEIEDQVSEKARALRKKYPAMSSDERTIRAAKEVARENKISFKSILKNMKPSNNIKGQKTWDSEGNVKKENAAELATLLGRFIDDLKANFGKDVAFQIEQLSRANKIDKGTKNFLDNHIESIEEKIEGIHASVRQIINRLRLHGLTNTMTESDNGELPTDAESMNDTENDYISENMDEVFVSGEPVVATTLDLAPVLEMPVSELNQLVAYVMKAMNPAHYEEMKIFGESDARKVTGYKMSESDIRALKTVSIGRRAAILESVLQP